MFFVMGDHNSTQNIGSDTDDFDTLYRASILDTYRSSIPDLQHWLTHRARTPGKWTQMDEAAFGLRTTTPSQKQNAFSINHVDARHLYRK